MKPNILLSHYHQDQEIVQVLAKLIQEVTRQQINIWFSSDMSGSGGIEAGDIWLNTIQKNLEASDAIVAVLTPQALNRPWIYFESGFAAGNPKSFVIPICVGIDSLNDIPFPLAMYEAYQLINVDSLKVFLNKLLAKFELSLLDSEATQSVIQNAITQITNIIKNTTYEAVQENPIVDEIKRHVDRRFYQLSNQEQKGKFSYSVPLHIKLPNLELKEYIVIDENTMVSNVADRVYFMLQKQVKPFSYLVEWVFFETNKKQPLVIEDFSLVIPAKYVFAPETTWEVRALEQPYTSINRQQKKHYLQ
ncbi:toll/interleukin-1 receptor domain-containing protein [Candidatus Uabimicrobium amorphum]|uniref:TIR domain-containing protein n=1 Tax=Uabimicrobium amorphum TaxID=2596890 RepID=A0A5S9IV38_UABAM|nr:toll/interleukin-1 receptor domain-containing protein [Candidatus Uabimicrobium amorphum]BBM88071.1 hypothetical protein UABAM_06487 [Candidatus Uabimicrobium amorphum]